MTRINTATHEKARLSLGRFIREYSKGDEIESQTFRDIVYAMNTLLAYFKHASDLEIERRLEVIEDQLEQRSS